MLRFLSKYLVVGGVVLAWVSATAAEECSFVQIPTKEISVNTCFVRAIEALGPREGASLPVPQIKIEFDGGPDKEIHFQSYGEAKKAFDRLMEGLPSASGKRQ